MGMGNHAYLLTLRHTRSLLARSMYVHGLGGGWLQLFTLNFTSAPSCVGLKGGGISGLCGSGWRRLGCKVRLLSWAGLKQQLWARVGMERGQCPLYGCHSRQVPSPGRPVKRSEEVGTGGTGGQPATGGGLSRCKGGSGGPGAPHV